MKISKRVARFLRSRTGGRPDQARDPGETVETLYARQQETLRHVRRGLADVAAARTRVDLRTQQTSARIHRLQQEAEQSLSAGHEEVAREALGRRAVLHRNLTDLARQHEALRDQEDAIARSLQTLQFRVEEIRIRMEGLDAARRAADARTVAARSLSGFGGELAELNQALGQAEHETAALQATAAGLEELLASNPALAAGTAEDGAKAEFDRLWIDNEIEQELTALRDSLDSAPPPGSSPLEERP